MHLSFFHVSSWIDTLLLLSCYAGNYDYFKTNPAYKFFYNNTIRQMVCCDGAHRGILQSNGVMIHKDVKDKNMKKYLNLNRETYGFLLYRQGKKKGWLDIKEIGHEFSSIEKLLKAIGKW